MTSKSTSNSTLPDIGFDSNLREWLETSSYHFLSFWCRLVEWKLRYLHGYDTALAPPFQYRHCSSKGPCWSVNAGVPSNVWNFLWWQMLMLTLTPTLILTLTLTLIHTIPWTKRRMITLALTLCCKRYHRRSNSRRRKWGQILYHRFMYKCIAPSSDHSLLTLNLPFKVILRRFEIVFWCLEWELNAALDLCV